MANKSYYGYVERDASSQINWSEVGKSMSDMLLETAKAREQKKAEIDKASREFGKILSDSPQGEHQGTNDAIFGYAEQAQEMMLLQSNLLKTGQLNLREYNLQRQNLMDGTNEVFDVAKEWNTEYAKKLERMTNCEGNPDVDCSAELEQFLMEDAEGMVNFNSHSLYINPTNYQVNLAKRIKNDQGVYTSEIDSSPGSFETVSSLRNRISNTYNKFKLQDYITANGATIADYQRQWADGTLVNDATRRGAYKEYQNGFVASIMSNDYDALSILTDTIPRGDYFDGFTWDEEEAAKDSKKVLLQVNPDDSGNPIPVMNDTQKTAVADMIKAQMDVQVKSIHKKPEKKTTERTDKKNEESKAFFDRFNKLNAGDESTFEAVSEEITQEYNNVSDIKITKINRNDDSFTVLLRDPEADGIRTLTIDRYSDLQILNEDTGEMENNPNPSKPRSLEDVAQELYQYIKPTAGDNTFDEDISLYQPGFVTQFITNAQGEVVPNPNYAGNIGTDFQRDKMYPDNIELSQLIIEEGTGQQGDTTAIGLLKGAGNKPENIATATERILNMGLGQFLEEDITIDAKRTDEWGKLSKYGTVKINVGDKPYEIKWEKDVNTYGDALENLMNQILSDLKAPNVGDGNVDTSKYNKKDG